MGEEMVIFAVSFSKEGIEKCLFQKMKPAFIKDETSFHQGWGEVPSGRKNDSMESNHVQHGVVIHPQGYRNLNEGQELD
jgi:hypothetical protein